MGDGMTTIREEKSAAFWQRILDHPQVEHVKHGLDVPASVVLGQDAVRAFASDHGGYLAIRQGVLGRVYEIHALYLPEGRGKEACEALKLTLNQLDADVILATETRDPQSRPPLSFGFRPCAEFRPSLIGETRTWVLIRDAWRGSAPYRRMT